MANRKNSNVAVFESTEPGNSKNSDVAVFEITPAQFDQVAQVARVDLDVSAEALAALGADELGRAELSVLRAGVYFLKLKELSPHGGFLQALEAVGVDHTRALRSMQIASYVGRLPADQAKRIAQLPKSKVLPLINADQEVVRQLLEEGELDGDEALSVRELRAKLKAAEAKAATLTVRIETVEAEKLRLARDRSRVLAEEDLPAFALEARQESIALTESMGFCLDNLQSVIEVNVLGAVKHPEALRWQPIAAGTAYHSIAAIHARCALLMKRLNAHFGNEVTGTNLAHALSPAEMSLAVAGRAGLLAAHQAAAKTRDAKRENNRPGKAGRKRDES